MKDTKPKGRQPSTEPLTGVHVGLTDKQWLFCSKEGNASAFLRKLVDAEIERTERREKRK